MCQYILHKKESTWIQLVTMKFMNMILCKMIKQSTLRHHDLYTWGKIRDHNSQKQQMCTNNLQLLLWMANAKERWCISKPCARVGIPRANLSLVMDRSDNRVTNVIKLYVNLTHEISLLTIDWCLGCWFHVYLLKRRYSLCEQLSVWVPLRRESTMPRLFVFRHISGKEGASHVRSSSVVLETMFVCWKSSWQTQMSRLHWRTKNWKMNAFSFHCIFLWGLVSEGIMSIEFYYLNIFHFAHMSIH